MITEYVVGNLSYNDNSRIEDYQLVKHTDQFTRSKEFKLPDNKTVKTFMTPDNHTQFICEDDNFDSYTKDQVQFKIRALEANVQDYKSHTLAEAFTVTVN